MNLLNQFGHDSVQIVIVTRQKCGVQIAVPEAHLCQSLQIDLSGTLGVVADPMTVHPLSWSLLRINHVADYRSGGVDSRRSDVYGPVHNGFGQNVHLRGIFHCRRWLLNHSSVGRVFVLYRYVFGLFYGCRRYLLNYSSADIIFWYRYIYGEGLLVVGHMIHFAEWVGGGRVEVPVDGGARATVPSSSIGLSGLLTFNVG